MKRKNSFNTNFGHISVMHGFTLVELLVVMALIAVLAVLILGAIQLARSTATETVHRSNAKVVQAGLESNFAKYKEYCGTNGAPELACPTPAGLTGTTTTFSLKQAAATMNASLSTGYSTATGVQSSTVTAKCGTGEADEGGGRILYLSKTGYAVIATSSTCTGYTAFNDMIQSGAAPSLTSLPTF